MQFDLSTSHTRFAAYEIDWTPVEEQVRRGSADQQNMAAYYDRYFGLQEQELAGRMSTAAQSSADRRAGINAQMKAEANRIALAREQMEKIGIPELQLKQWVAEKQNKIAELGVQLDYLKAFSEYQSNPDMYWVAKSFKGSFQDLANSAGGMDPFRRAEQGGGAQQDRSTLPQPQSLQTLVADLTGGTGAGAAPVDQANAQAAAGGAGGGGTGDQYNPGGANPAASGNSAVNAMQTMMAASPPSPYDGLDENDTAILRNIESIYKSPGGLGSLPMNALASMDPTKRKLLLGGGARLGFYNPTELFNAQQGTFTQGSSKAA